MAWHGCVEDKVEEKDKRYLEDLMEIPDELLRYYSQLIATEIEE